MSLRLLDNEIQGMSTLDFGAWEERLEVVHVAREALFDLIGHIIRVGQGSCMFCTHIDSTHESVSEMRKVSGPHRHDTDRTRHASLEPISQLLFQIHVTRC